MEMKTNLLIQIVLCAALFLSIFFLARSNSETEREFGPRKDKR